MRLPTIARAFALSKTSMVLRLAEVRGDERVVVTKNNNVIIRTKGAYPWADIPIVDVARDKKTWRDIVKTKLSGGIDDKRVALRAR
jgi:hypothetical protein